MDTLRTAVMFFICLTKIKHSEALLWDSKPEISSDLIKVYPNQFIERYQFQKIEYSPNGNLRPRWDPKVTLVNTWVNAQKGNVFYMNCAMKKEGSYDVFKAILYVLCPTENYSYKPIKNLEVAHCERNILNAVTIVPNNNKVSWIIYVNQQKECIMDIFNMESKTYETTATKCPPVGSKRGPQKNGGAYTNNWKEIDPLEI